MELYLGEIRECFPILSKLIDMQLPINISWRFTKLLTELNDHNVKLEEFRIKLVERYGVLQYECSNDLEKEVFEKEYFEQNQKDLVSKYSTIVPKFEVKEDKVNEFYTEWKKLLEEKVEIEFTPIWINDMKGDDIKLSPREMVVLNKFFR